MSIRRHIPIALSCLLAWIAAGCATGDGADADNTTAGSEAESAEAEHAQAEQAQTQQAQHREGAEAEESDEAKMERMMEKMMTRDKSEMPSDKDVRATVTQPEGKVTYWVLPGERKLDTYFGTEENPRMTADVPDGTPRAVRQLIAELPILIGVPERARTYRDGEGYTKMPTPFGDKGVPVEDSALALTYIDRQSEDMEGPVVETADEIEASITFTDPEGNAYELQPLLVMQPPIPGYDTQGGVLTDSVLHGTTGTGSPLMPEVYTWGAFWAVGNVLINDEVADRNKVMHCMTTETVRDKNYELAMQDDLPLAEEETIAGQMHHTHCIVLPIELTPEGPTYAPVQTAFELPNGKMQPFIHVMYENDQLEGLPWRGPTGGARQDQ